VRIPLISKGDCSQIDRSIDTSAADIRDLVSAEDVMQELQYGPNGALIYCMEYVAVEQIF
jgi:hypothetical protein